MSAEHYFSAEPTTAADQHTVRFTAAGRSFELKAAGGVFSAGRLDPGTAVLLRKAPLPAAGVLLDLGCGYGPIAAVLAASVPAATVYAVDVNARAVNLVRANAAALKLTDRLVAATPEEVPDGVRFDQIWSNPPIRIGKPALHAMLARWLPRLAPGGTGWLVVARHLGADSLQEWLTGQDWLAGQGWSVRRYASQKGYRILRIQAAG
ncbi:MAG: methyltransferase [Micromonosporaceae bacterium]|nr:methyltransferase [Micromonosporaceae bacterium]